MKKQEQEEKFELMDDFIINIFGIKLFRLKAKVDGKHYKKGEIGGFVESLKLKNGGARVFGDAWVSGNAQVYNNAQVSGDARVFGDAWVSGNAQVYNNAQVSGDAWVSGDAQVYGDANVSGNAWVYGKLKIDFILCSRFNFQFDWQIELWKKLELNFEKEVKKITKVK